LGKSAVVGVGLSKFGKREDASLRELAAEAVYESFQDARDIEPGDVEAVIVASSQPERLVVQSHVAPLICEYLGVKPSKGAFRVESACSSGGVALRMADIMIRSGEASKVLVVGVEKMTEAPRSEVMTTLSIVGDKDWESIHGITAPAGFALAAQRHMLEYGTKEEHLGLVAVKNHANAELNPKAMFRRRITLNEYKDSPPIARPLKLLDCSPICDGASCVILTDAEDARKYNDTPVVVKSITQTTIGNSSTTVDDLTTWKPLVEAASRAYSLAGISPKQVDVAEVHDCFTIAEIIEYEDLGFCGKGYGGRFVEEGQSAIGGEVAVNTSGGLKAKGHPIGATGIAQVVEITLQLRGEAGKRQVSGADIGLTHNLGGFAVNHVVGIYGRMT